MDEEGREILAHPQKILANLFFKNERYIYLKLTCLLIEISRPKRGKKRTQCTLCNPLFVEYIKCTEMGIIEFLLFVLTTKRNTFM